MPRKDVLHKRTNIKKKKKTLSSLFRSWLELRTIRQPNYLSPLEYRTIQIPTVSTRYPNKVQIVVGRLETKIKIAKLFVCQHVACNWIFMIVFVTMNWCFDFGHQIGAIIFDIIVSKTYLRDNLKPRSSIIESTPTWATVTWLCANRNAQVLNNL